MDKPQLKWRCLSLEHQQSVGLIKNYPLKYPVWFLGKEAEVLEALKSARAKGGNFSAYTHNEMLDRWHYKHCARTPPILLTADLGFLFSTEKHNTG